MNNDEWLDDRVKYLKGFKSRSEQQELLVLLSEKLNRTAQDDKKFNAIIRAEKASLRATKARQDAANLINTEKKVAAKAERTARTHELCNSAGLLILAGLVDTKTGKPAIDKGELLGALLGPAQDDKKFNAIIRAEKASLRATKARQDAANLINTEKKVAAKAERVARTHELCNSAGLLILAGLVDTKTGQPTIDRGELLGALLGLAKVPAEDPRRLEWKRAGDSMLTEQSVK